MNSHLEKIKPSVRAIEAYHLKERAFEVKLNQNESPYDVPGWLKSEIFDEFKSVQWNRYPTFVNSTLSEAIARSLGVFPEQVLVGNGSNELLEVLIAVTMSKGKKLLLVAPTFSIYYQLAKVAGAEIVELELADDWSFPVDKIIATLQSQHIDLCILCSPNSPTGSELSEENLERILQAANALVLLDEAYYEFSENNHIKFLSRYPNLMITRTFSKAMGLAGLRIGYMLAAPDLIVEVNKGKLPYNLNLFSEMVAAKLLQHKDLVLENIKKIKAEKNRVIAALQAYDHVTVYPSQANFFLIETKLSAKELFEKLLTKGVLVRDVSGYHPKLKNNLRVSVGTPAENDAFLAAIRT